MNNLSTSGIPFIHSTIGNPFLKFLATLLHVYSCMLCMYICIYIAIVCMYDIVCMYVYSYYVYA